MSNLPRYTIVNWNYQQLAFLGARLTLAGGEKTMIMHISSTEAFLFAVALGEMNSKGAERVLKLTSSIAAKKGISKILIDGSRVTGTLSAAERVELGERLADHVKRTGSNPSVAFVGHAPTTDGLAVLAARGRGVNIMRVNSVADGLKWLRHAHVSGKGLIHAKTHASAHPSAHA